MDTRIASLAQAMLAYEAGCPHRAQHFLKVWAFAQLIASGEGVDQDCYYLIEAAALTHDIGIRPSLEKYGSSSGPYQEKEGPPVARSLLEELGFDRTQVDRICYLIGHHHTYTGIDGMDYQILVEADFLVNIFEEPMDQSAARSIDEKIFKTPTGHRLLTQLYLS